MGKGWVIQYLVNWNERSASLHNHNIIINIHNDDSQVKSLSHYFFYTHYMTEASM